MSDKPQLLPVGPMARRLRVPVKWLRDEADAGRLPHLKAGRAVLFDPDAVESVLCERAKEWVDRDAVELPLLDENDVAEMLRTTLQHVEKLIKAKAFPYIELPTAKTSYRERRFYKRDIVNWIRSIKVP